MVPLAYFEQRCQQIGPEMAYILCAKDRSPGTLLDQTPRKENKGEGEKAKIKKTKSAHDISAKAFPKAQAQLACL
ncbi:hypothetical protein I79_020746 [Cricetulus griseus]|uniref:Uncharacterized protein n=1 Tax=Cricetulus griseus TaxID=10029 RepID=G3IAW4_CRIGR|nr:hypothetical protein I79_020746 [Cricetulus griseus]